jgi:CubicO group peptidase (beta-lactamase class C family)
MMAIAVDKGWCGYDDKVEQHWPEFTRQNSCGTKQDLMIKDILRHEANMENFCRPMTLEDLYPENLKQNSVGKIIEESN